MLSVLTVEERGWRDEQGRHLTETDMPDLVTFMDRYVCSSFWGSIYAVVFEHSVLITKCLPNYVKITYIADWLLKKYIRCLWIKSVSKDF